MARTDIGNEGRSRIGASLVIGLIVSCGGADGSALYEPLQVGFDDFREQVHETTCSSCHGGPSSLPDWGDYEVTQENCALIRERVISEQSMPPPGVEFRERQRSLVDVWTAADCPRAP